MKTTGFMLFGVLAGLFTLVSCHKQYLRGYYNRDTFLEACEWKKKVDEKYEAKIRWMDSLRTLQTKADVKIYLGTYCPDSKKWVSRFFALQDSLPIGKVSIISVDTTKKDEKGWAIADSIKKIPTFIFQVNGLEKGRITEKPKGRLEKALFTQLKNCQ